jgi:hypothetical protein
MVVDMEIPEEASGSLKALLDSDPEAYEYFESLHPSVKARIVSDGISSPEELAARANMAARAAMLDYSGIYDDSDSWPNGPKEP